MRARPRWLLLLVLSLGLAGILGTWTVSVRSAPDNPPRYDGRYVEAVAGAPGRINPLYASFNDVDRDLTALVFSGLTRLDGRGRVVPDLARSWDVSKDGRTYTFHLRRGVLWHDRHPFTADDVVFTFHALADPNFAGDPALTRIWRDITVQKVDDLTVRFDLPAPYAPFLAATTTGIIPKHLLDGRSAQELFDAPFNRNPVGTGPFRLVEVTDTGAVLERNPLYHRRPPYLEHLELRFYRDYQAAIRGVLAGQADGVLLRPVVAEEDLVRLADAGFQTVEAPRNTYTILYLNNRGKLFRDVRTRRAVAMAIDRERIVREIFHRQAAAVDTPIMPDTWAAAADLPGPAYDPPRAKELLAQAGWKKGEDGVLANQDGTKLSLTLLTNGDDFREAVAARIAEDLRAVGIQTEVSVVGAGTLLQQHLLPRKYEAALYGWDGGPDPDPYPAWHSSQVGEGQNLADWASEEADPLMQEARQTSDLPRRAELYGQFQEIFVAQVPSVAISHPVFTYALRGDVRGVEPGVLFQPSDRFRNVEMWYRDDR